MVNQSIFPVTVTAAGTHNLGHFYMPRNVNCGFRVLDLLEGPRSALRDAGRRLRRAPAGADGKKTVIAAAESLLPGPVAPLPAVTPVKIRLTLGDNEPSLKRAFHGCHRHRHQ